ncbi:MAG: YceI family protein [Sulfuriferula sp.]
MKKLVALIFAISAVNAVNAVAAVFAVPVPEKSSITFISRQMGVPVSGSFGKFSSRITFDPARPEAGHAEIDVALATVNAGSSDANDAVMSKSWFDVKAYPTATFVSNGLKALGGKRYQATGKLTIKGRSHDVAVPFIASPAGALLILDGTIPISRAQYGIGAGVWADPSVVADAVQLRFHLTLGAGK